MARDGVTSGTDIPSLPLSSPVINKSGRFSSAFEAWLFSHGQLMQDPCFQLQIQLPLTWTRQESCFHLQVAPRGKISVENLAYTVFFGLHVFSTWNVLPHHTQSVLACSLNATHGWGWGCLQQKPSSKPLPTPVRVGCLSLVFLWHLGSALLQGVCHPLLYIASRSAGISTCAYPVSELRV